MIWQIMGDHKREYIQRDFLRFTAPQILKNLRNLNSTLLEELMADAKDRRHQVWERNSDCCWKNTNNGREQKVEYIHSNPVRARICTLPEEYEYSSARFYEKNERKWDFLNHYED